MDTKLTLSMDEMVIKKAKVFAKKNHTSLSQLLENYLLNVIGKLQNTDTDDISPLVKSLSGVMKLPVDFDYKKNRTKYLEEKYK
jgi:hypothetical protein